MVRQITSLDQYQLATEQLKVLPEGWTENYVNLWIQLTAFGLMEEAGEVAKAFREIQIELGYISDARRQELILELGDVMWFLAQLALTLNIPLSTIASRNIEKLEERYRKKATA